MIRATMTAVPKRLPVLWGKALVFGLVALVITLPAVFIVFFAGQAILAGQHINISISHPGVVRALFGASLYLVVMGLFGFGVGAILRSTAGGISALAAIVFVLPRSSGCSPPVSRTPLAPTSPAMPAARSGRSTRIRTRSRRGPAWPCSAPTRRSRSRSPRSSCFGATPESSRSSSATSRAARAARCDCLARSKARLQCLSAQ